MPAIVVDRVSKRFTMEQDRPRSLQELVVGLLKGNRNGHRETFWAVKDLSFVVEPGHTLGIIGENGSGKSTLLKLITRVLEPTQGHIEVNGRLAALLELGAGFHPDLTGRENIYLNGSILGLSRREIQGRFEEIVSFAELERFIDVPLKHYSSGMQVRLGFSIATCLDPDVLLVDEVLSVGDEAFQHKCLDRIDEIRSKGKTILFVSHDLATVNDLCDQVIWIEDGLVRGRGLPRRVIDLYLTSVGEKENRQLAALHTHSEAQEEAYEPALAEAPAVCVTTPIASAAHLETDSAPSEPQNDEPTHWGTGEIRIKGVRMLGREGKHKHLFQCGEPLMIEIDYEAYCGAEDVAFGVGLYRGDGLFCYGSNTDLEKIELALTPGPGMVKLQFDRFAFIEGTYSLDVAIHTRKGAAFDYYRGYYTFAMRSQWKDMGVFRPEHHWIVGEQVWTMSDSPEQKVSEEDIP
jgi:lipopolysaccharide transport system ATP-binding protein